MEDSTAKCNICQKNISFKSGSTNNLPEHLKTQHSTVKVTEVRREPAGSGNSDNEVSVDTENASAT